MKKTEFVAPELEVIRFAEKDIIMHSGDIDCTPVDECPEGCFSDSDSE